MSDPSATATRDDATEALTALLDDLDPLYRPAEFLLGYTYLRRGNATNATPVFARLVARFADERKRRIDVLREQWSHKSELRQWIDAHMPRVAALVDWTAIKWIRFGRHFSVVDRWVEIYLDLTTYLNGGRYRNYARWWAQLKSELDKETNLLTSSHYANSRVALLWQSPFGRLAAIAAGQESSQEIARDAARDVLDRDLDILQLWKFDMALSMLATSRHLQDSNATTSLVNELLQYQISKYFRPTLESLQKRITDEDWEGALELIRDVRRNTRDPSPSEFAAIVDNADTEKREMLLVTLFVPVFKRVRGVRRQLRVPLYIESMLYLAQSFLMRFDRDGLDEAYQIARALREERLAPSLPGRERDVYWLTICLETEALVRWQSMEPASNEESSLSSKTKSIRWAFLPDDRARDLTKVSNDRSSTPEVRAASYVSIGMLDRRGRRVLTSAAGAEPHDTFSYEIEQSLEHELEQYHLALELRTSATIHAYIAEVLLERKRVDDARAHIRQALLIAPDHTLAHRLKQQV